VTAVSKAQGRRDAAGRQSSKETTVLSSAAKVLVTPVDFQNGGVERPTNRSRHTHQGRPANEGTPG